MAVKAELWSRTKTSPVGTPRMSPPGVNLGPSRRGELRRGVYPPPKPGLLRPLATLDPLRDICGISGV